MSWLKKLKPGDEVYVESHRDIRPANVAAVLEDGTILTPGGIKYSAEDGYAVNRHKWDPLRLVNPIDMNGNEKMVLREARRLVNRIEELMTDPVETGELLELLRKTGVDII